MINRILGNYLQPQPIVNMGATELGYTDRHAGTIIKVGKITRGKFTELHKVANVTAVIWQRDKVIRRDKNGMSETQLYDYERDPDSDTSYYTLRKNGAWVRFGERMINGRRLLIDNRCEYFDYSF